MFTHTITTNYADNAGVVVAQPNAYTGQTNASYDGTIAANATDFLIDMAWPLTGMQALLIWSDTNLTVKTNSNTTPVQTIAVSANVPIKWGALEGNTNPITAAVTSLYVTNATANPAKFKVRALTT
jgi:hypothetical protein